MRSPGNIYNSIDQSEAGPLKFISRIEGYLGVHRSISGSGDEYGIVDCNGAARLFIPVRQIQRMEALEKRGGTCNGRLADDVERVRIEIDDRRAGDTDFRREVAKTTAYEPPWTGWHRSFARHAAMDSVNQIGVPERDTRIGVGVGVKSVNAIVLCGDDDDVVIGSANGEIGDPERLGVDGAVHGAREEFAEGGSLDVGGCQRKFVGIGSFTREIVVIGGNAREVGDGNGRGGAFGRVGKARCRNGDITYGDRSDIRRHGFPLTAESPAGSGPCHAGRANVVLKVRSEIQGLRKSRSAADRCDLHADRSHRRQGSSRAGITGEIPGSVGGTHAIGIGSRGS